jgi:DtxR family Mn-dependent transcriptional regulator
MAKRTVEDYVKAILLIAADSDRAVASTGQLAKWLNVTDGTASKMVRVLSEAGLVAFTPYEGAQLTEEGRRLATRVLRNHRLMELFLSSVLDMDWHEIHEEAESLEHAVSDRLIERIDAFLGRPEIDPHGDPIPRSDGTLPRISGVALVGCTAGSPFVVRRVLDQSPQVLNFLATVGLGLGQSGRVVKNSPVAGIVSIALDGKVISLSRALASKLLVAIER